jgi:serine/threonine protein kinase
MSSSYRDTDLSGVILGSYRIVSEISTGGMGTVYRAQHTLLDRAAAIKLLRPQLTANNELVERFFREARAASAIQHPGIIEVFDFGFADGRAYLVMEFLEGQPLGERLLARGGRLGEIEAAQIGRGIASALTAAHAKGIIHRDLKPDNVFLVRDPDLPSGERPKLLDFGIAKLADGGSSQTQTGALIGTPLYMAPEQARAAATIDARADLYSLGCILYELLVGEPPFVATGAGEIIAMHMFTPPQPPSQRVFVSGELEAIVMRLLDKDPRARFQSAGEVSEALAAIGGFASSGHRISPQLVSGQRTPLPSPTHVRKRSTRAFIAAAAVAVVAAVVTIVLATRTDNEPTTPATVAEPPRVPPPRVVTPPVEPPRVVTPPPTEPVVVEDKKPPDVHVVHKELPVDAGAGRTAPVHASETKIRTESGSPLETDVGDIKKNHKPLDKPAP